MKNRITNYHNLPTFRLATYLAVIIPWIVSVLNFKMGNWIGIVAFQLYVMISFTCLNNQRYYWRWVGLLLLYNVGSLVVVTFVEPPLVSSFWIVLALIDVAVHIACAVTALTISHREPTKTTRWLNRGIGAVYLLGMLVSTVMLLISL